MELGTFPVTDINMEVTFGHSSPRYLCTSFDTQYGLLIKLELSHNLLGLC